MRVICQSAPQTNVATVKSGTRRDFLLGLGGVGAISLLSRPALAANTLVSNTLPAGSSPNYYLYAPTKEATPMLRAGVMQTPAYQFELEGSFAPERIPNPETGGFCAPNCGEPWKEAFYSSEKYGRVELLGIPLVKFTFKKGVKIEDLGTPDALLNGLGPYLTGSSFDPEEVEIIESTTKKGKDGQTYYSYYINSDYVQKGQGNRILAYATVRGDVVEVMKCSATDKQFKGGEEVLRKVLDSFRA